jgi:hypothetical protein
MRRKVRAVVKAVKATAARAYVWRVIESTYHRTVQIVRKTCSR